MFSYIRCFYFSTSEMQNPCNSFLYKVFKVYIILPTPPLNIHFQIIIQMILECLQNKKYPKTLLMAKFVYLQYLKINLIFTIQLYSIFLSFFLNSLIEIYVFFQMKIQNVIQCDFFCASQILAQTQHLYFCSFFLCSYIFYIYILYFFLLKNYLELGLFLEIQTIYSFLGYHNFKTKNQKFYKTNY